LTFDSNGNPINPKPNILAIQKKGQLPTVTAPSLDTPRIGRTPYTGVVPKPPDAPKPNRIPLVGKDGIHPQELDVSYNAGLPGFGREVGNLLKNNLGGSIAGLGVGLMTDPELHQAVSNKDGLKVLNHIAKDTVGGAMTQAATRLLPGAVGARVAALANPIGAATLAAAAPSSSDLGKQREKLLAHVNRLPAAQKQTALAQIEKDDKAAAKPLIDGDAIVKKAVNEVEWGLKLLQGKAKNPPTPSNKPTPIPTTSKPPIKADLSGKLSAAQIRSFQAGGGQAAMLRDGLTREQVIERGSALLLKQKYG
jgi:hypothetical protein